MLVVLSFHAGDKDQAINLANWINELGGVKKHDCLLVIPTGTDGEQEVSTPLCEAFRKVDIIRPLFNPKGWPQGPNAMFDAALRIIEHSYRCPFLWIEPDAIPLKGCWVDEIEKDYNFALSQGLPFMGDFVDVKSMHEDGINHMSGVAVYPAEPSRLAPTLFGNETIAWDIVAARHIVPLMFKTKLIQHTWKMETFATLQSVKDRIRPEAVLFHQCKDGSLIKRLKGVEGIAVIDTRPIVKTFYDPLGNLQDPRLMELWQKNWDYFGWRTQIATLQSAKAADERRFALYRDSKNLYAGVCAKDYLFRCYARWLCMEDGGFMVDFDVFNYGFTPRMLDALMAIKAHKDKVVHLSGDSTPCATFGNAKAYEKYIQCFDRYDAKPELFKTKHLELNVHDQNIIDANPQAWTGVKFCSLYPIEKAWESYPLIHYTNGQCAYPRSERVPKILPLPGL